MASHATKRVRRDRYRDQPDGIPKGGVDEWPPTLSAASDLDTDRSDGTYCGHCHDGPFSGMSGLRSHHGQKHPDLENIKRLPDAFCCFGRTDTTRDGRRFCLNCGLIFDELPEDEIPAEVRV